MTPIIEDAILGSDLDCQHYELFNVNALVPVPDSLVTTDHPALTDQRPPLDGSVTNDSVAADAAIVQSKLSLDGQIPTAWLGATATTAAQGDLAEYLSNKNQPDGYCGLDGSGKVDPTQLPGAVGTGTVTSVALTMPAEFDVTGSPITSSGTIDAAWADVADLTWFGNKEGSSGPPQFYTDELPPDLIPALDASKVTTGTFDESLLPSAVGVGVSHAPGKVPTPGAFGTASDYLGRDMAYHSLPVTTDPLYQPTVTSPTLTKDTSTTDPIAVIIALVDDDGNDISDQHHVFFYSITSASTGFIEFPAVRYVKLPADTANIWGYAAHPGMTNSAVIGPIDLT